MYDRNSARLGPSEPAKTTAPRDVGEIGQYTQRLEATISSLSCALDRLGMRLTPILHGQRPLEEPVLANSPPDTEMGGILHSSNQCLIALVARIDDLCDRIAL